MSSEQVEVTLIRPRAYIAGIVGMLISIVFTTFVALFTTGGTTWGLTSQVWATNQHGTITFVLWWPLLLSLLASILVKGGGLTKQELTIVLSMIWISWTFPTFYGVLPIVVMMGTTRQIPAFHRWNLEYLKPVHWQWGPDPFNDALWDSWMYGGPVPWDAWMPALTWHTIRVIFFYLMYLFFATFWRRQWIDIEALPFPQASAAARLIDMAYEKVDGRTALFENVWLWLGLLIGFFAILPYWGWTLPGLGLSQMAYTGVLGIDLTPLALVPHAPLNFNADAFFIGLLFLVPLKTLFSYIVVSTVVFRVIWPIISYAGIWEPTAVGGFTGGVNGNIGIIESWTGPMMRDWMHTWGAPGWIGIGAFFGLTLYPALIIYRSEFVNGVKAVFGKTRPEIEEREPVRYAYMLAGFIIFLALYLATWWYGSLGYLPVLGGLIWVVINGLYWMGRARVAGDLGLIVEDCWNEQRFAHYWNSSTVSWLFCAPESPFFVRDLQQRYIVLRTDYPWYTPVIKAAPMASLLETYKIGSLEGVHSRHIFAAAVIAIVVGVTASLFIALSMWCTFGAVNLSAFNYTGAPNNHYQRAPTYRAIEEVGDYWRGGFIPKPTPNQWILFAVGFLITAVTYSLSMKYPWFPLNAPGTALGLGIIQTGPTWFPAIIAYIAKTVVIRMGGVRMYEEKAMPFAIGLAVSVSFATLLAAANNFAILISA